MKKVYLQYSEKMSELNKISSNNLIFEFNIDFYPICIQESEIKNCLYYREIEIDFDFKKEDTVYLVIQRYNEERESVIIYNKWNVIGLFNKEEDLNKLKDKLKEFQVFVFSVKFNPLSVFTVIGSEITSE